MKRLMMWMTALMLGLSCGLVLAADLAIGPGDVVKASVYGNPDLAVETRISDNGRMTFPLIGQVEVGGLTVQQAEKKIAGMLESGNYVKKPQVNMIVTQVASAQVSVLGMVNRPGRYPLEGGKRSVMDMLAQAGGFNADGGDTVSLIRTRNGASNKTVVDVVELVRNGSVNNEELAPGDVIYAERSPRFYIYGEVQRPGAFRLERQMTVSQALAVGGGLTPRGTERGIKVKRRGNDGQLQMVNVKNDDIIQVDDVIYIKESWF